MLRLNTYLREVKTFETQSCEYFQLEEEAIVIARYKKVVLTAEHIIENEMTMHETFHLVKPVIVVDSSRLKETTALSRIASLDYALRKFSGIALLTPSFLQRLVGNVSLRLSPPEVPIKLIANEAQAIKWAKNILANRT